MTSSGKDPRTLQPDRRYWFVVPFLLVGLVGLLVFTSVGGSNDAAPVVESAAAPVAYSILYETTHRDSPTIEERLEVSRPFRSRFSTSTGSERITNAGVLATSSSGARWIRIEVPIAIAGNDVRPLAVLNQAIARGFAQDRGTRLVAGRPCRIVRLGGPVSSGTLTPVGFTADEYADVCIDGMGLVLAEDWIIAGELGRHREAVEVTIAEVDPDRVLLDPDAAVLTFEDGGGAVAVAPADVDPGFAEYWTPGPIEGFDHLERWSVVPPAIEASRNVMEARMVQVALITDAWTRGADLVLIDQGASVGGAGAPWSERPVAESVDVGAAGTAEVVWDLRMSEVRVSRPDGGFVRVAGTLPPSELVAIARSLTLQPGGPAS